MAARSWLLKLEQRGWIRLSPRKFKCPGRMRMRSAEAVAVAEQPLAQPLDTLRRYHQCRFKRTGQFETTRGDEGLLCLETCWRNGRWDQLYPHAISLAALN